jgi:hypothetical protein
MRHFTAVPNNKSSGLWRIPLLIGFLLVIQFVTPDIHLVSAAVAPSLAAAQSDFDPVVDVVETGRGSSSSVVEDALVFEARVFDPRVGNRNGDGIDYVDMIVLDEDGREVYRKRETDPSYCAFGGTSPCPEHDFAENDNRWPNRNGQRGEPIRDGEEYTLRTLVRASNGDEAVRDTTVEIRLE